MRGGVVQAISVIATSLRRAGPVAFVHTARPTPRSERSVRYVRVRLRGEHVRASAAIPLLFPPVEVTRPRAAAGHYIDGGTRLNAPIAPALALGADRIIVIGLEPLTSVAPARHEPGPPSLADVGANVLDGLLVDRVIEDVRRMTAINSFFVEDASGGPSPAARAYRVARGRAPYKRIAYALISPERRGALGDLAEEVFRQRYGGWRGLRSPDFLLLARLLGGGRARDRGELLSFLLFDETYVAKLLAAGRADAALAEAAPRLLVDRRRARGLRAARHRSGRGNDRARRIPHAPTRLSDPTLTLDRGRFVQGGGRRPRSIHKLQEPHGDDLQAVIATGRKASTLLAAQ